MTALRAVRAAATSFPWSQPAPHAGATDGKRGGATPRLPAPRVYLSIHPSPKTCLAERSLWKLQASRTLVTVDLPPFATARMWSNWSRWVEPQTPPSTVGQAHLPPSRIQTARRTAAGM